jgi:hypothetical protein
MSLLLLGILNAQAAGASGPAYRIQIFGGSNNERLDSIQTDSSGNVYLFGEDEAGDDRGYVIKTDRSGSLLFSKVYVFNGKPTQSKCLGAISVGGQIFLGQPVFDVISETSSFDMTLARIDSDGALQFQRSLGLDPDFDGVFGLATDSSNNAIISGTTTPSGGFAQSILAKYNSSGTIQWQRLAAKAGAAVQETNVATDLSDNVYAASKMRDGSFNLLIIKYNSSGTLQWQRDIDNLFATDFNLPAIKIDANGDVYVSAVDGAVAGNHNAYIAKFNSSGTIQWQRSLTSPDQVGFTAVDFDSNDDVYVSGFATVGANKQLLLVKYNSSGVIQYQRTFGGTAQNDEAFSIHIDDDDNILIGGQTRSAGVANGDSIVSLLPNDGSLTGTYSIDSVDFTYASSSFTDSAATFSVNTPTVVDSAGDLTDASTTATATDRTYTEFITLLT